MDMKGSNNLRWATGQQPAGSDNVVRVSVCVRVSVTVSMNVSHTCTHGSSERRDVVRVLLSQLAELGMGERGDRVDRLQQRTHPRFRCVQPQNTHRCTQAHHASTHTPHLHMTLSHDTHTHTHTHTHTLTHTHTTILVCKSIMSHQMKWKNISAQSNDSEYSNAPMAATPVPPNQRRHSQSRRSDSKSTRTTGKVQCSHCIETRPAALEPEIYVARDAGAEKRFDQWLDGRCAVQTLHSVRGQTA